VIPAGPWDINPALWDKLVIDDREWPGLATVEIARANKWDDKKTKGEHGGEREFSGTENASVNITIKFWTDDHWTLVRDELLPIIEPLVEKTTPNSHSLSHAVSDARKVKRFTVDRITGPTRSEIGIWTIKVEATEYRPPSDKNATGTVSGSGTGTGAVSNNCQDLANQYALTQSLISANQAVLAQLYVDQANHDLWLLWPIQKINIDETNRILSELQEQLAAIVARQNEYGCNSASGGSAAETAGP
jgi:hypothetical protein